MPRLDDSLALLYARGQRILHITLHRISPGQVQTHAGILIRFIMIKFIMISLPADRGSCACSRMQKKGQNAIPRRISLKSIAQQLDEPVPAQAQTRAASHLHQATRDRRTYLLLYQPLEQAVAKTPHDALSCRVE